LEHQNISQVARNKGRGLKKAQSCKIYLIVMEPTIPNHGEPSLGLYNNDRDPSRDRIRFIGFSVICGNPKRTLRCARVNQLNNPEL